jgi:hypothetical protein
MHIWRTLPTFRFIDGCVCRYASLPLSAAASKWDTFARPQAGASVSGISGAEEVASITGCYCVCRWRKFAMADRTAGLSECIGPDVAD